MLNNVLINKTMDFDDIMSDSAARIRKELNDLICFLDQKKLKISSWYGHFDLSEADDLEEINKGYDYRGVEGPAFDKRFPWFLYWEIIWLFLNNEFLPNSKILDLGGSSSLFSYYLASKGFDVTTVDIQQKLVENADYVAGEMGWKLKNQLKDMRDMQFSSQFDHITSVCVYEHIPMADRIEINKRIRDLLVDGGKFSITFDYRNPSGLVQISSPKDVYGQFVAVSGLKMRGNTEFYDNKKNYLLHPFYYKDRKWKFKIMSVLKGHFPFKDILKIKNCNDYTFGALFLEK